MEDSPKFLSKLNRLVQIVRNPPEKIKKVRDKKYFFDELSRLKIPYPETRHFSNLKEAEEAARGYQRLALDALGRMELDGESSAGLKYLADRLVQRVR